MNYNRLQLGTKHSFIPSNNENGSYSGMPFDSLKLTSINNNVSPCDTLLLTNGSKEEIRIIKETRKTLHYTPCNLTYSRVTIPKIDIAEVRFNDGSIGRFRMVSKKKHELKYNKKNKIKKSGLVIRGVGRTLFLAGIIATIVSLALPIHLIGWISLGLLVLGLLIIVIGLLVMHYQGALDYHDLGGWFMGLGIGFGGLSIIIGFLILALGGGVGILVALIGGLFSSVAIYFGNKMRAKRIMVIKKPN